MKKFSNILSYVFSFGMIVCLFAGGLSLLGYMIAIAIGGEPAVDICTFIFKTYLPYVIKFTSVFTGIGLIQMYLTNQKALSANSDKKDK